MGISGNSRTLSDSFLGCVFYIWTGALQIEQSEEADQGKYECVATNSAGTRYSAPANLYVRGRNDKPQCLHSVGNGAIIFRLFTVTVITIQNWTTTDSVIVENVRICRSLPEGCKYFTF